MPPSYSVSFRLQRVTTETAFVSVPITPAVIDGDKLDVEKLTRAAVELGKHPLTRWELEEDAVVTPHPIQMPPPASD
jgi:hypothetical protein